MYRIHMYQYLSAEYVERIGCPKRQHDWIISTQKVCKYNKDVCFGIGVEKQVDHHKLWDEIL